MKPLIKFKTIQLLFIALLLGCLALLPRVQAAPDPPAIGGNNTRDGAGSLANRTTGQFNTAFGTNALFSLTTANNNTAQGNSALFSNTIGGGNVAIGSAALRLNVIGDQNTAVGYQALYSNNSNANVAIGWKALQRNTLGKRNVAVGFQALSNSTTFKANGNTAVGYLGLFSNTEGDCNTAIGQEALYSNIDGRCNTAVGVDALYSNTTGWDNTAIGKFALVNNTTGSNNIALGTMAGVNQTTGDRNIYIGANGVAAEAYTIRIGSTQPRTFIAGIRGRTTGINNAVPVVIDSAGQLGTVSSSRRFKNEVKPMNKASEAIYALKPVTFHYKSDNTGTPQFGLIAEEVAEVNPDLIVRDENGEIYTVRYEAVNAMLLNEFLKEHRKNEEQEATIARQQKQIEALTAGLQKVGARLEAGRPAAQVAENNP